MSSRRKIKRITTPYEIKSVYLAKSSEEFEKQLGAVTDRKNSPEYSKTVTTQQKVGG